MDERHKLRVLLPHWIEHNVEHADEFRRWAERAGAARDVLLEAAGCLDEATRRLNAALDLVGGPLETPEA